MVLETMYSWALAGVTAVVVPCMGYLVRTTVTNDQKLKTHEATDALRFAEIKEALTQLKKESASQTEKLDDLVDRMPRRRH